MKFARPHLSARLAASVFAALFIAGLGSPAFAQWKWKDKNGHVQYSDLPPPPGVSDSEILQRPAGSARRGAPAFAPSGTPAAAASAASGAVEPELEAKRRKAEQDEIAKKKAEEDKLKAARADNCQRARAQLRALEDGSRIARVNAKGEREFVDDKTRAEEAQRTRDIIGSDCK